MEGKVRTRIIVFSVLLSAGMFLVERDPGQAATGADVYHQKKCHVCHTINGKGGKFGGDLSHVGAKRDAQWLTTFLKDPKAANPETKMSPFKGSDEELQDLVAYLLTLK
jgi:mono/diheme cytochrome c family protein